MGQETPASWSGVSPEAQRPFATRMPSQAENVNAVALAHPSIPALPRLRWSLARQFLLANLAIVVVGVLITGYWLGNQIQTSVLDRTAVITALYVDSVLSPHLQTLSTRANLTPEDIASLDNLLSETGLGQGVVVFKVWSPDYRVVYSPDRRLMGRQFPVDPGLAHALDGDVSAEISNLDAVENEYERARWSRLIEVYEPVRDTLTGKVIASTEFYQLPDALDADIAQAQLRSWIVVSVSGLLTYLLLAGIVKRGSDTIRTQQERLQRQVRELQRVLEQNARLHERVRQAAGRTTALNEQALRRISADLHDGPGQTLALALLRLESLQQPCGDAVCSLHGNPDFQVVQSAVKDALSEVRAISAGLRLPELAPLALADVAERAISDHERRSGTAIDRRIGRLPEQAPLAIKIGLLRTMQEALSNATRHGGGVDVAASVWADDGLLRLEVSDRGPGFDFESSEVHRNGRLGLAGMRERAELLGGTFEVTSELGKGTLVSASWPLPERAEMVT
jgi:signal transduction histidine kinase